MTSVGERPYLSIGEVLGLLLEEFPDVTISKIRFLESQGLIDPERTASGYRKFYDGDVDRLRVILREQRENFLPLRVIRDRLESGAIDDSGGVPVPRGIRNVTLTDHDDVATDADETTELHIEVPSGAESDRHPAARMRLVSSAPAPAAAAPPEPTPAPAPAPATLLAPAAPPPPPMSTSNDSFTAADLCHHANLTAAQLAELESFGLLSSSGSAAQPMYTDADLAIAVAAAGFLAHGVEGRHLRAWRQAADREAALFEQMVLPLMRQRNPQARQQAAATLQELAGLGAQLRASILQATLRHHLVD